MKFTTSKSAEDCNTTRAQAEIDLLLSITPDAVIGDFADEIISLVEAFNKSGQSGGSAPYTAKAISQAVEKLCLQKPIAPITGEEHEWMNISEGLFQNNRCSAVFKLGDMPPYYLDAIVFKGEDAFDTFTGSVEDIKSSQYIKFPFEPKTFYIDVIEEDYNEAKHGRGEHMNIVMTSYGGKVFKIKDRSQLDEVYKYYIHPDKL